MRLHTSGEDYLKVIYILQNERGCVRSVDIAERMGVTKPSVSHASKLLREGGFLIMNDDYTLHPTDLGKEIAKKLYERHILRDGLRMPVLMLTLLKLKPAKWSIRSAIHLSRNSRNRNKKLARMLILVI